MSKFDYFDSLERLCALACRAVFITCSTVRGAQSEILTLRHSADRIICETEGVLFADFWPPLERASICSCAHGIARIIEKCSDIINCKNAKNSFGDRKNREAELCIRLSQLLEENVKRLKHLKRPEELPDLVEFRKLVCDARNAHASMQRKLNSGVYPRSAQHYLCLLGRLRCELASAFDKLVEVMLGNV